MYKKVFVGFLALCLLGVSFLACGIHDASTASGPTVHMSNANFNPTTITIHKGDTLTVIDDVSVQHTFINGEWVNGVAKKMAENGAPQVNLTFNGGDSNSVGPFNTAGTFHFYCSIHSGMNLTVVVQ
ncbi:MAG TPA: plastocyanin/azurin family copper-binding protein [Ktedonobacteraceae bacterium]|jgi:plastocyanin|nr:plastocyanin/azurin family copper-binding protein [Ktedonobacteraceae bacterium]